MASPKGPDGGLGDGDAQGPVLRAAAGVHLECLDMKGGPPCTRAKPNQYLTELCCVSDSSLFFLCREIFHLIKIYNLPGPGWVCVNSNLKA